MMMMMMSEVGKVPWTRSVLVACLLVMLLLSEDASARRGMRRGGKRKSFSRMPIVYTNPESDDYYNHPNGARITSASHFESEYMLGRKIVFVCVARGDPRPRITWFKDGIEVYAHHFFHVHEWPLGDKEIKSKMEIDPATQKDAGLYECQADNRYSVDRKAFRTDYAISID
ncbi:unnamed protein product [Notodromas monacha]|uniref:Ig-like domain-containing protein n=1 Tax=Notodromas monacha TaxID=399045 RepID=A0A7R9BXA1_9CRUS|nr:unnamed protein product [Notodromas monacha]CAG0923414.1 unnamed protein product [Notodromas monacha]